MDLKIRTRRIAAPFIALGLAAALLSGCSAERSADTADQPATEADALQISETWIKAADDGMTSGFAVIQNPTDHPASLVQVDSNLAEHVELHDMEGTGTAMSMKKLPGALEIPAHSTVELAPGGTHVMLMGLKEELKAGQSPALHLTFGDGSTREVAFEIKSYTGAKESYAPHDGETEHGTGTEGSEHAGH
ncbi:copper chaperone PCu(A)C [Paeniglutamicibacter gangotriensis]|uniref:Copper chaperone PCu(A)C n=1 Tax=Paeniglutamicibacter gangotriensis Lz1y TaxID=1276920 RepID=M7MV54_9MICC|nr:copper chaperone PCu(A)C [Paeniglutamicibacter gangotriensis]EMQ98790.1 hypothetical protein ADIAG_01547 [Paeniglutamicibacter gangotriensis Lz1y]